MDLYDELPESKLLYEPEFTQLLDNANRYKVSVIDFLTLNLSELSKSLQRSIVEVNKFYSLLINEFMEQYETKDIVTPVKPQQVEIEPEVGLENQSENHVQPSPQPHSFTTGDVKLDEVLGGGIFFQGITEFFGESSTGKSQLLMQLGLTVQLPRSHGGIEGKCVFITTEGDLTTQRIQEMIDENPIYNDNNTHVSQKNIFTVSCNDLTSQDHIMNVQLPILLDMHKGDIKLIVIDSISHHLRVELESKSFRNSQVNRFYIERLAERLLSLANKHDLAIVVANQVGDKPLMENAEPVRQLVTDYDYQMGWMVGWKDSSIMYRHRFNKMDGGVLSTTSSNSLSHGVHGSNSLSRNSNTSKNNNDNNNDNNNNNNNNNAQTQLDDILSDDEDSMLVEKEVSKVIEASERAKQHSETLQTSIQSSSSQKGSYTSSDNKVNSALNQHDVVYSKGKINTRKASSILKKRKLDSKVPNLGLSWANYVSTRILLKKSYKASPMVKRGEIKIYRGMDESSFWQVKRELQVVFSSYCGSNSMTYAITKRGIESTEN